MLESRLWKNIKYYGFYQLLYVVVVIILSSVGAFFHFLLNHEISIVESWLHNNQWEILIIAKLISLFVLNRWFTVQLYQLKTFRSLVRELVHWPEPRAFVVSLFMLISYIVLGKAQFNAQNFGYWYYHIASFLGLLLFFGIEFIVIAYLDDILNQEQGPSFFWLGLAYTVLFTISFKLSVPDYYGLLSFVILCFSSLMYLSGRSFKSWSNILCFLIIFIAPMGSLFGMDPIWGNDFSPFRLGKKIDLTFLAVIWMLSFFYYQFRDQIIQSTRKLMR